MAKLQRSDYLEMRIRQHIMQLNITKDWFLNQAHLEEGLEIGAGALQHIGRPALRVVPAARTLLDKSTSMRIRQHRGGFLESCATIEEIEPTMEAVAEYMRSTDFTIEHYGFDDREPWNAECFIINSPRMIAFCDQMPNI